jgi:hypothetical protein
MAETFIPHEIKRERVHICYGHADRRRVVEFAGLMKGLGHYVLDDLAISGSKRWRDEAEERLRTADVLLVFWTRHAAQSVRVRWEYEKFDKEFPDRPLIPVLGDSTPLPDILQARQYSDFRPARLISPEHVIPNTKSWLWRLFSRRDNLIPPEDLISNTESRVRWSFEFYSCFISYSSQDEEFAKRLYADLGRNEVQCWFAPESLRIGERFRTRIDEAIRVCAKVLLVLSTHSITSQWVEAEVKTAFEEEG